MTKLFVILFCCPAWVFGFMFCLSSAPASLANTNYYVANLVENGSIEFPDISSWHTLQSVVTRTNEAAFSGNYALKVARSTKTGWAEQRLLLEVGRSYNFSVKIKRTAGSGTAGLKFFDDNSNIIWLQTLAISNTNDWFTLSAVYTPSITVTNARVFVHFNSSHADTEPLSSFYIDDFTVACSDFMPEPAGVPASPSSLAVSPGGAGLPDMAGEALFAAPQISMVNSTALPDESLVITGDQLSGAELELWAEGERMTLTPLRTMNDRMQAVVPASLSTSTMLLWPVRDGYAGTPVRVNGPEAWWAFPACVNQSEGLAKIHIYGRNLIMGSYSPVAYLKGASIEVPILISELTDGGFECVDLSAWKAQGATLTQSSLDPFSGNTCLQIDRNTKTARAQQKYTFKAGQEYRFSVWVRRTAGTGTAVIKMVQDGSIISIASKVINTLNWTQISGTYTPSSTLSDADVFVHFGNEGADTAPTSTYYVDDFSVQFANPYALTLTLPDSLPEGDYELSVHNGSGGIYGWSEPVTVSVQAGPQTVGLTQFSVAAYGAVPNDGGDDGAAIQSAIDAAVSAGGGDVVFAQGIYYTAQPLYIPASSGEGIHLKGVGMGGFTVGAGSDLATATLSGSYSALYPLGTNVLSEILCIENGYSSVSGLTIVNYHQGTAYGGINGGIAAAMTQCTVRGYAAGLRFTDSRFVLADGRPKLPFASRPCLAIYDAALHLAYPGTANIRMSDCEIHSAAVGLQLGWVQYEHTATNTCAPGTDNLKIENCSFTGYAGYLYQYTPGSLEIVSDESYGIYNFNASQVTVENCLFSGADRTNGVCLNRSIFNRNTSIRHLYLAGNAMVDVGVHPATGSALEAFLNDGGQVNEGEQILFHYRYPHGGYFDVIDADYDFVTIDPDDPRNAGSTDSMGRAPDRRGSRIPDEIGSNDHWLVYVAEGKGAGQYRQVASKQYVSGKVKLAVEKPFRVVPDSNSEVLVFVAYRENIIFGNVVDSGLVYTNIKTAGAQIWLNAVNNIMADNIYANVGYGSVINSSFRNPCLWNLISRNTCLDADGFTGGGTRVPEAFHHGYYRTNMDGVEDPVANVASDCDGWYTLGNIFRYNYAGHVTTAGHSGTQVGDSFAKTYLVHSDETGLMMDVMEHNEMDQVVNGIEYDCSTSWLLLRNNSFSNTLMQYKDRSQDKTTNVLIQ
jgi:hypothetical protein